MEGMLFMKALFHSLCDFVVTLHNVRILHIDVDIHTFCQAFECFALSNIYGRMKSQDFNHKLLSYACEMLGEICQYMHIHII